MYRGKIQDIAFLFRVPFRSVCPVYADIYVECCIYYFPHTTYFRPLPNFDHLTLCSNCR